MEQNKFYWLKLKRDFFKRHDIQIIENMPNGKDYVLFYLKLMCESIDHNGNLRFSDTIPYNENMLSTITNTNIDIVKSALKLFCELNMIEILDNQTIFMNEVEKLIGCAVDNDNANRQRRFRERKKTLELAERYGSVTKSNENKSIDIEKDIEIDNKEKQEKKNDKKRKVFVPPTYEEVLEYAKERGREDLAKQFFDYFSVGEWIDSQGNKVKSWKQKFITWCSRNEVKKGATNGNIAGNPTTSEITRTITGFEEW